LVDEVHVGCLGLSDGFGDAVGVEFVGAGVEVAVYAAVFPYHYVAPYVRFCCLSHIMIKNDDKI